MNESSDSVSSPTTRMTKLMKPAKVQFWTKEMSLDTYAKQIATWTGINEEVPEYIKFHDLMEELKIIRIKKGCKNMLQTM